MSHSNFRIDPNLMCRSFWTNSWFTSIHRSLRTHAVDESTEGTHIFLLYWSGQFPNERMRPLWWTDNPFHLEIFHRGKRLPVSWYRNITVPPDQARTATDVTTTQVLALKACHRRPRFQEEEKWSTGLGPGRRSSTIHVSFPEQRRLLVMLKQVPSWFRSVGLAIIKLPSDAVFIYLRNLDVLTYSHCQQHFSCPGVSCMMKKNLDVKLAWRYHEKHQKLGAKVNSAVRRRWAVGYSPFFFALILIGIGTCKSSWGIRVRRHGGCRRRCI